MRRLFLAVIMICCLAGQSYAVIDDAVSTTLNTSTYVQIKLPARYANQACVEVAIWTSDLTGFYLASDSSGTGVRYVPETFGMQRCLKADADGTVVWAKAGAGTPTLYVDPGR